MSNYVYAFYTSAGGSSGDGGASYDGIIPYATRPNSNRVNVSAGVIRKSDGRAILEFPGGVSPAFEPVSASGVSRIDLLTVDNNGILGIIKGAEGTNPSAPLYPTDRAVIAEIYITETTNVIITSGDILDVRDVLGPTQLSNIDCGNE